MNRHRNAHQRGAAAVEFALVVPILLVLVMGIVEFGYLLYLQGSAAGAAREAARAVAIAGDYSAAGDAVASSMPGASPSPTSGACVGDATVTVTYTYDALTSFFGASHTASGTGVMRCGG